MSNKKVKRDLTIKEEMQRLCMNIAKGSGVTHLQGKGNLSKILGCDKADFTIKEEDGNHLLIITPSATGKSIKKDEISWQTGLGGEIGKKMAQYIGKHYMHPSLVTKPVGDTGAFISVVEFNLNDFEKPQEEPKQEEVKPTNMNVRETLTFADAVSKVLHQQEEILERIKRLEEAFK